MDVGNSVSQPIHIRLFNIGVDSVGILGRGDIGLLIQIHGKLIRVQAHQLVALGVASQLLQQHVLIEELELL